MGKDGFVVECELSRMLLVMKPLMKPGRDSGDENDRPEKGAYLSEC
jgi:hypothetical protein